MEVDGEDGAAAAEDTTGNMDTQGEDTTGKTVIIDMGSDVIRAGFAADDGPRVSFPCASFERRQSDVSDSGEEPRGRCPLEDGVPTNWAATEKLWRRAFSELGAASEGCQLFLTEAVRTPPAARERMAQIAFESLGVGSFYLSSHPVLCTFATGRTTACVVDCGHAVSRVVPVHEGWAVYQAIQRLPAAGRDLTTYVAKALNVDEAVARDVKERHCLVRARGDAAPPPPQAYALPDGTSIDLGVERCAAPELLFDATSGCAAKVVEAVATCDKDHAKDMYPGVLLAGGTTYAAGFAQRLDADLRALLPASAKLFVFDMDRRRLAPFFGASLLTTINAFDPMFMTKAEYDAKGPRYVGDKCPGELW